MGRGDLGDHCTELGRVRHDRNPPDQSQRQDQPGGGSHEPAEGQRTRPAHDHGTGGDPGATDPIGPHPRNQGPDGTCGNHDEAREPCPGQCHHRGGALLEEMRAEEDGNERPHGVEFPHVPGVAEDHLSRWSMPNHLDHPAQGEGTAREGVGSDSPEGQNQPAPENPGHRGPADGDAIHPRQPCHPAHPCHPAPVQEEKGKGLAQGERPHHSPNGHPTTGLEPRRGHLHGRGVDPGEKESRHATRGHEHRRLIGPERHPIGASRKERRKAEQDPGGDQIGQIERGHHQRPQDEPQLNRPG